MKTFNKLSLFATSLLFTSTTVHADCSTPGCVDLIDPRSTNISTIIIEITRQVLNVVGGIAVLFVIYAGVLYVTSAGNKDRVETAKKTLTYAVIGLAIIVLSKVIIALVTKTAANLF